jgi:hypothetical protein
VICARRKAPGQLPQAGHRGILTRRIGPGVAEGGFASPWLSVRAAGAGNRRACPRSAPPQVAPSGRQATAGERSPPAGVTRARPPGTHAHAGHPPPRRSPGACAWSPSPRASGPRSEADRWSRHTSRPRRTTTSCTSRPSPPGRTARATSTSNHHHRLHRPAGKHRGEGWVHDFKARPRRGA